MPWTYDAPLEDMRFVIERVLNAPQSWAACDAFADVDIETVASVLEEGNRFARGVLLPTHAVGDLEGCTRDAEGNVRTPSGFAAAYKAYVDGGWPALPCDPAFGGQGLPLLVDAAVREMLIACNHAWEMYPDLLHGAIETLRAHGSDALKAAYLPKLVSGEWLAAMSLTEPQAGSDLGLLRTRAMAQPDGSVRVSGDKCFISGGDHDLTDNIVHLVLCRLPHAPAGSKGVSLALVPKVLPDGTRNAWRCEGLERKMGIHGSATCVLHYDGATGWLVGQPNRGLAAMFVMMNSARMHVGLQGLAAQEVAMQNALAYAQQRMQMRAPVRPPGADAAPADAIVHHPAMRHALLGLQARTEAQRVMAYRAAQLIDEAEHHPDAATRERAGRLAALLTPIVKTYCTHQGFHGASAALQVFGGYGFIAEYGIEQCVRDARIAMIYEGTNEIQAIDLVQRKVIADRGATLELLLTELDAEATAARAHANMTDLAQGLAEAVSAARAGAMALIQRAEHASSGGDPEAALVVADDFLMGLSHTLLAWAFCASARASRGHDDAAWAASKLARMRYGMQWLVPGGSVHWTRVTQGDLHLPHASVLAGG
jgi:alkylation response protein AidB-like acyl-CoA dehydrogenase